MMSQSQSGLTQLGNESVSGRREMRPVLGRLNTGDVAMPMRAQRAVRFNPDRDDGENAPSSCSESDIDSSLEDADYHPPIVERKESFERSIRCKIGKTEAAVRQPGGKGKRKIKIELIKNKTSRYATFSKRKTGIMKKAHELAMLTGTQVFLLLVSETGHLYTNATRKLQPMLTGDEGKALIQTCLNSPDPPSNYDPSTDERMSSKGFEETDLTFQVSSESGSPNKGQTEASLPLLEPPCSAQSTEPTAATIVQLSSGQSFQIPIIRQPIRGNFTVLPTVPSGLAFHSTDPMFHSTAPMYNGYNVSPGIQTIDSSTMSKLTELQVVNTAQNICNDWKYSW